MRTVKNVSAGLNLIAEKRKVSSDLERFLDMLDTIPASDEETSKAEPIRRPYSGRELQTTERWK